MDDVKYVIHYLAKRSCIADKIEDASGIAFCDLTFVTHGELNYTINGQSFTLKPSDAMFCPEGARRRREKGSEKTNYISVNFKCALSNVPPLPFYIKDAYSHDIDYCLSKLIEIHFQSGGYTVKKCSCLLEFVLCELLDKLSDSGGNKHVALMKRYISYNWQRKTSLKEIAQAAHLSESYCSAVFKKAVGVPISDYITDIRIERACELLRFSDESVSEIAEKTGFCDIFYFSRTFKKIKGMSPMQYRAMK